MIEVAKQSEEGRPVKKIADIERCMASAYADVEVAKRHARGAKRDAKQAKKTFKEAKSTLKKAKLALKTLRNELVKLASEDSQTQTSDAVEKNLRPKKKKLPAIRSSKMELRLSQIDNAHSEPHSPLGYRVAPEVARKRSPSDRPARSKRENTRNVPEPQEASQSTGAYVTEQSEDREPAISDTLAPRLLEE